METIKLLLVEDNPVDALYFKEALEEASGANFAISHVETLGEAKATLEKEDFNIVVLDLGLPDCQRLGTLTRIQNSAPNTPVVVLSGLSDEALAIEALRRGAQDYILKGQWDEHRLSRVINYAIERHRLLTKILGFKAHSKADAGLVEHLLKLRDSSLPSQIEHSSSKKTTYVPDASDLSRHEMGQLIHELQVHQIELEMQNEELQKGRLELEKSREEYSDLYEFAPAGYLTLDARGGILKINLTGAQLFGQERDSLLNKPLSALLSEDDADTLHLHLDKVFSTHAKQSCELRLLKDGSISYIQLESAAINGSGDRYDQCRTILTDITNRKHAEQALRLSEQRFRAIFEAAEDYIFVRDLSLRYTDANPAVEKLLDLPISQIVGRRYEDLFGKEGSKQYDDADLRVLAGQSVEEEQTRTIHGMPRTFLDVKVALKDDSGEIVGLVCMSRDITDRKRLGIIPLPELAQGEYPSKAMRATLKQAKTVAKRASTILLTGESGSGKDFLAKFIHDHSDRANGPYFSINCAAITPELAESELFGHEKGSFTGAVGKKRGLLELAEGGTLLLNEIGELSLSLQAKLLTFLDTKKFTRVGGEKLISVNARLIAATNRDLEKAVETGGFRKDLFYRLNVVAIAVPPLRKRLEDIPILVQEILAKLRDDMKVHEMPRIDPAVINALKRYDWPGNVRELRNVLERALILSHGQKIDLSALELIDTKTSVRQEGNTSFSVSFPPDQSLNEVTQELKRFLVNEALRKSGGKREGAARILGISRYSLKHYMKTLGYSDENE